jgi:hypothetical protein
LHKFPSDPPNLFRSFILLRVSSAYSTGRTSSHTHDPLELSRGFPREGVKVGVSSSLSVLTDFPLTGDAESSERSAALSSRDGGSWEGSARITSSPGRLPLGEFWGDGLVQCAAYLSGYNSIPTTRWVGRGYSQGNEHGPFSTGGVLSNCNCSGSFLFIEAYSFNLGMTDRSLVCLSTALQIFRLPNAF